METRDFFWKLPDASKFTEQRELYEHLDRSNHLKNCIFEPDILDRQIRSRTQKIESKKFERVSFSKTEIQGIIFNKCTFLECQLIGTKFVECEFHDCKFENTNVYKVEFEKTYIDPRSFRKCLKSKLHQNIGVHLYQVLMNNSRDNEQVEFERYAHFMFLRWKRHQDFYEFKKDLKYSKSFSDFCSSFKKGFSASRRALWEKLFGSGIRLRYYILTMFVLIFCTSLLNYTFSNLFGLQIGSDPVNSLMQAIYFTVVSLTTLGYGDITPTTDLGRLAASIQSVLGFSLFALLASMLFRKVSP